MPSLPRQSLEQRLREYVSLFGNELLRTECLRHRLGIYIPTYFYLTFVHEKTRLPFGSLVEIQSVNMEFSTSSRKLRIASRSVL